MQIVPTFVERFACKRLASNNPIEDQYLDRYYRRKETGEKASALF